MEQIRKIEKEIDDLKEKIDEYEVSQKKQKYNFNYYADLINEERERIETRKQFIQAIIKNIEINSEYVNQQEVKRA